MRKIDKIALGIFSCLFIALALFVILNILDVRGTALQRYRNKYYRIIRAGTKISTLPEEFGEPEFMIPFKDGSKLQYYAGVHASFCTLEDLQESYKSNNVTGFGAYAFFQIFVSKDEVIEACVYCGETDYYMTVTGIIRSGGIDTYIDTKYGSTPFSDLIAYPEKKEPEK